ncbi:hypothetical protein B0H14DRAFT_3050887, partial [Mycena olivaceomarginata]
MILTHLPASRNTVHARVAEMVQAVVGNKVHLTACAEPRVTRPRKRKASTTLACTSSSSAVTRGHERAAGIFVEPDGVPGGVSMQRVWVRGLPFTSLNSLPSPPPPQSHSRKYQHRRKHLCRRPAPSMSSLMLLVIITRCCFVYYLRTVVLIFCKVKAEYALYYRHSLLFLARSGWIVHGADCFALWNTPAPRVCEGIGRRAGPL